MNIYQKDKKKSTAAAGLTGDFTPTGSGAVVSPKATPPARIMNPAGSNDLIKLPLRITDPVGSHARTKPQGTGRNVGSINTASPRTTANVAGGWSGTATPQTPVKTPSQLYDQYKDDPMVDQYMEEMRKQAAAPAADDMDEDEQAAYDEAVYNSLVLGNSSKKTDSPYRTAAPVDEATKAARQAQADAYDAARRGAGGAGTSYAALAGSRAYNEAYEGVREREAAEAEAEAAEEEAAIEAAKEQRLLAFETVAEAYDGSNEATLFAWLTEQGFDQEDAWEMIDTVAGDWKKKSDQADAEEEEISMKEAMDQFYENMVVWDRNDMTAEDLEALIRQAHYWGLDDEYIETVLDLFPSVSEAKSAEAAVNSEGEAYDEEMATAIYGEFSAIQAGTSTYGQFDLTTEAGRASCRSHLIQLGFDEADVDAAFDKLKNYETDTAVGIVTAIANGLENGHTNNLYTYAVDPDGNSYTAEEWAEMDDDDRAAALLEGMGHMVSRGELQSSEFVKQAKTECLESVDSSTKKGKVDSESIEMIVTELTRYVQNGWMSEEEKATIESAVVDRIRENDREFFFRNRGNRILTELVSMSVK